MYRKNEIAAFTSTSESLFLETELLALEKNASLDEVYDIFERSVIALVKNDKKSIEDISLQWLCFAEIVIRLGYTLPKYKKVLSFQLGESLNRRNTVLSTTDTLVLMNRNIEKCENQEEAYTLQNELIIVTEMGINTLKIIESQETIKQLEGDVKVKKILNFSHLLVILLIVFVNILIVNYVPTVPSTEFWYALDGFFDSYLCGTLFPPVSKDFSFVVKFAYCSSVIVVFICSLLIFFTLVLRQDKPQMLKIIDFLERASDKIFQQPHNSKFSRVLHFVYKNRSQSIPYGILYVLIRVIFFIVVMMMPFLVYIFDDKNMFMFVLSVPLITLVPSLMLSNILIRRYGLVFYSDNDSHNSSRLS